MNLSGLTPREANDMKRSLIIAASLALVQPAKANDWEPVVTAIIGAVQQAHHQDNQVPSDVVFRWAQKRHSDVLMVGRRNADCPQGSPGFGVIFGAMIDGHKVAKSAVICVGPDGPRVYVDGEHP